MKQSRTTLLTVAFVLVAMVATLSAAVFTLILSAMPRRQIAFGGGEIAITASKVPESELKNHIITPAQVQASTPAYIYAIPTSASVLTGLFAPHYLSG